MPTKKSEMVSHIFIIFTSTNQTDEVGDDVTLHPVTKHMELVTSPKTLSFTKMALPNFHNFNGSLPNQTPLN